MPLENIKFQGVSEKLLKKIHRNKRRDREAASSREWERIHDKSASQTGAWNLIIIKCELI